MANKIKSKGTSVLKDISGTYTAIPQIRKISKSGEASETYDGRTLDGNVHSDRPNTGYVSNPDFSIDVFYDPDNTVHAAIVAHMRTPAAANYKLTRTNSSPTSEIWSVTGVGVDEEFDPANAGVATFKLMTSGEPS